MSNDIETQRQPEERTMFEIHDLSTAAMKTELEYRHNQLAGPRQRTVVTRGRWWHRRESTTR